MLNLEFPPHIRKELESAFNVAWDAAHDEGKKAFASDHPLARQQQEYFLRRLSGIAEGAAAFRRLEERKQQDRRRAMAQVANAADRLADGINRLDADARAFLLYLVVQEIDGKESADRLNPFQYFDLAQSNKAEVVEVLSAVGLAARRAEKELPLQKTNAALSTALGLERFFWECGFPFNASHFSFAAKCLEAVFDAGGIEKSSLQYWIEQARDHPESMSSFMQRERLTQNP